MCVVLALLGFGWWNRVAAGPDTLFWFVAIIGILAGMALSGVLQPPVLPIQELPAQLPVEPVPVTPGRQEPLPPLVLPERPDVPLLSRPRR